MLIVTVLRTAVLGAVLAGSAIGVTPVPAAADGPTSVVDDRAYPGAEEIFAEHGIRVITGDGNIRYAPDCNSDPDLFRVERLVGSDLEVTCFEVRGPRGFLTMQLQNAFLVRGADRPVTAKATYQGETETVTVPPHQYEAIGGGAATHTLVELRVADTLPEGQPSTHPFVSRIDTADGRGCSGVLIAPQWVATTKTCLAPGGDVAAGAPPQAATVTVGQADMTRSGGHSATIVEAVPRADRDLVLARLSAPATGITPISLAAGAAAAGDEVLAAGYGRGATDWTTDRMRVARFTAGATTATTIALTRAAGNATSTCKGDGGGPAFRPAGAGFELLALHSSSWHTGCFGAPGTVEDQAVEVRTDDLGSWINGVITPPAVENPLRNVLAGAALAASSSTEGWGWALRQANDGVREGAGWSSLEPPNAGRTEWIEFTPAGGAKKINRVDLYPRSDSTAAGFNFPVNFTIHVLHQQQWRPVLTRTNHPNPGTKAQRFTFPAILAEKVRITGDAGRLMQLAEVEAYLSDNLLADATVTAASSTENWGWSLRYVNDVRREGVGWSSLDPPNPGRPEWIEFALPEPRTMNRVDLYPRSDSAAGGGFPANLTIEVFRAGQWRTAVSQTNVPNPGASPKRYTFAPELVERLRIRADAGRLLQFAEVEAYRSNNLLADAAVATSSSTEGWGWSVRYVNDGVSEGAGWSSLDPPNADRREWIQFAFPGPRTVNRLDLYPRSDAAPGGGFPVNFTVEGYRDGQWRTVLTFTDYPNPGAAPQRFHFPAQPVERLRITADANRLLQFAEVAAYHV